MKTFLLRFFLVFLLAAPIAILRAEDIGAVKARMAQRVSSIDEMKSRGVVGEDNRGFVEARPGTGSVDQSVIDAENKDREAAYAFLAGQQKSSTEEVGRTRARHIARSSVPGVWIQDETGAWKKK